MLIDNKKAVENQIIVSHIQFNKRVTGFSELKPNFE